MTTYKFDRAFTNYVHKNIAVPKVYTNLKWYDQVMNETVAEHIDRTIAVDYTMIDIEKGKVVTVQERFRDSQYAKYDDITIRYRRDLNTHEDRKESEYFKIKADYFVYGVVNGTKTDLKSCTDFTKVVVINMPILKQLIAKGLIIIDKDIKSRECIEKNGKMICPVNCNTDPSSSFVPFSIRIIKQLSLDKGLIVYNKGY